MISKNRFIELLKAKPFKKFLEDLGISQKFARPRTPNDNPFVESLFATTKGAQEYPENFTDDVEAIIYFTAYFDFYNNARLHGAIGYVTPAQRHRGEDKAILALRDTRLSEARKMRLQKNRHGSYDTIAAGGFLNNQPTLCLTGDLGKSLIQTESGN